VKFFTDEIFHRKNVSRETFHSMAVERLALALLAELGGANVSRETFFSTTVEKTRASRCSETLQARMFPFQVKHLSQQR